MTTTDATPRSSMLRELVPATGMLVVLTLLCGLAYPVAITYVARFAFPREARGSRIVAGGREVGSRLVGQPFDDAKYFWSRPSATSPAYNAASSSGSNLGPTNPALRDAVQARVEALRASDPANQAPIPVDLVTASSSGLDPHESPAAALWQVPRVARARGLPEDRLRALVASKTEPRLFGFLGEPVVDVLELNLALDQISGAGGADEGRHGG